MSNKKGLLYRCDCKKSDLRSETSTFIHYGVPFTIKGEGDWIDFDEDRSDYCDPWDWYEENKVYCSSCGKRYKIKLTDNGYAYLSPRKK